VRRSTDAPPPSRTLAHLLVIGLVAFAAVSGFATTHAGTGSSGLAFVDLARGADGDTLSPTSAEYQLVPDPENPGIQIDRGFHATVPDPTPLPTPVAPPKVKTPAPTIQRNIVGNGQFVWPVPGGVISQYYSSAHEGIDIAAPIGTPVLAGDAGVITFAGWTTSGAGLEMTVDHGNGFVTHYYHLSEALYTAGEVVTRGQQIGKVGSTGNSTGPHLMFVVVLNGVYVNPLRYL